MKTTIRCLSVMLIPWLFCSLMGFSPHLHAQSGPITITSKINSSTDDAEENLSNGSVDLTSSDLEMVKDDGDDQMIGLRFTNISIPQGVTITNAYIQFITDETPSNTTNLIIRGEASHNASTFGNSLNSGEISARPKTGAAVNWAPPVWNTVYEAGPDQQTPDISAIIQEIIGLPNWTSGNPVVLTIEGSGKRVATSFDKDSPYGAELVITYDPSAPASNLSNQLIVQITDVNDDAEEMLSNGQLDLTSSDLEMIQESGPQIVGMRFNGISIPAGATIENAYIQFTVDEHTFGNASLTFRGEDVDNAAPFTGLGSGQLSGRSKTSFVANWNPPDWPTKDVAGVDQQSPDLKLILQEIIDRPGWSSGNSVAFFVEGSGKRVAKSYDKSPIESPQLFISYKLCDSELADENLLNFPFVVGQELFCQEEDRKQMKYDVDPNTGNIVVAWNRFIDPDGYDAQVYFAILDANYQLTTPPAGQNWPIRVDTEATTDLPSRGVNVEIEPSTGRIAIGYTKSITGPVSQAHGQFYHRIFDASGVPLSAYASGGILFNPQQTCSSSNPNYCYEYTDHFDITWGPNNKLYFAFQPWGGLDWWARFPILVNAFNVTTGAAVYTNAFSTYDVSMNLDWRSLHSIEYDPAIGILVSEYREYNIWSGPGGDFVGIIWDEGLTSSTEPFSLTGGLEAGFDKSDGHVTVDDGKLLTSWIREPLTGGAQVLQAQIAGIGYGLPDGNPVTLPILELDVATFSQVDQVYFTQNDFHFADNRLSVGYSVFQNQAVSRRVHAYEFDNSSGTYIATAAFPQTIYQDELDHPNVGTGTTFYGTIVDFHQQDWTLKLIPGQAKVLAGGHIGEFVAPRSATADNATDWLISGTDLNFSGAIQPCSQLPFVAAAPSQDQNYILSTTYRKEMTDISQAVDAGDAWQSITYFNGLGLASQSQEVGRLPDGSTLIQPIEYDDFLRQPRAYMPYGSHAANGSFQSNPLADQQAFYGSNFPDYGTGRLFAESIFETSPLNRIVESAMPGDAWKPVSAGGNGHTSKSRTLVYGSSVIPSSLVVPYFAPDIVPGDPGIVADYSKYAKANPGTNTPGDLMVQMSEDEDENVVFVFMDKLGRQLMQSVQVDDMGTATLNDDVFASTLTLYNELGLPICILPPKATEKLNTLSGQLNQFVLKSAFLYSYDQRLRMVSKKVPDKVEQIMLYNHLDQLVLTQDGNQVQNDEYSYIKYDELGQVVETGIVTDNRSLTDIQADIDALPQFEVRLAGGYGYSTQAFPDDLLSMDRLNLFYYHNRDFDGNGTDDVGYADESEINGDDPDFRNWGQVTGVRNKVLGADPALPNWLWTVNFFNKNGQEIQTHVDHLYGTDISTYEVNFSGELTKVVLHHAIGSPTVYAVDVTKRMCYLHNGRLKRITHQNNNDPEFVLASYDYDALGRQVGKQLYSTDGEASFLQDVNLEFNIQGWLTEIDAPNVFHQQLGYDSPVTGLPGTVQGLFNGNISSNTWSTGLNPGETHNYGYEYDHANRLTDAHYLGINGVITNTTKYGVRNIEYDLNGNILQLKRNGLLDASGTTPTFGLMDDLVYSYDDANRLLTVNDLSTNTAQPEQFIDRYEGNPDQDVEYVYDANGNIIKDKNKEIDITYDHNNLVTEVEFYAGSNVGKRILYPRLADGTKLQQITIDGSTLHYTDYINGFQYDDFELRFFAHEEGRMLQVIPGEFRPEFFIQDHLGSNRATIADVDGNGSLDPMTEIVQEDHFYPFGLRLGGLSVQSGEKNRYLYTGKEAQDAFGLGWTDFGARMYDASIGRWNGVDALSEEYVEWSPYNYVLGNPVRFIDPDGNSVFENKSDAIASTFIDPSGTVIEHRDDGDPGIYLVYDYGQWVAGGKGKDDLPLVGVENPHFDYQVGSKIDLSNHNHNRFAPQNGALVPEYPIEELLMPAPMVFKYLKVGGKWILIQVAKVGNRFLRKKLAKLSVKAANESFEAAIEFSDGKVLGFLSDRTVKGKTLELTDIVFYAKDAVGNEMVNKFGVGGMKETLHLLKKYAKDKGFTKLRIQFQRAPNSSSSQPGKIIDKTFSL